MVWATQPVSKRQIEASAPGKLVIAGEYAVLAGAPALVAAIDRFARCTVEDAATDEWRFLGRGFDVETQHTRDSLVRPLDAFENTDPGRFVAALVQTFLQPSNLPSGLHVTLDTRGYFDNGVKLGIGSSAAVMVCLAFALGERCGSTPTITSLLEAHRRLQGGVGSGVDVGAAFYGGVLRFQANDAEVDAVARPIDPAVRFSFIFTGVATSTAAMIRRFEAWREVSNATELDDLAACAHRVCDCTEIHNRFIPQMAEYIDALVALDRAAGIGIFGIGHTRAREIARDFPVLYKPCGAGGGDMGVAISTDRDALEAFNTRAASQELTVVPMEITQHGVRVRAQ